MPLALVSPFWLRFAGVAAVLGAVFAGGYKVASSHYGGIIAETRAQHLEAVSEANRQSALVNEANRKASAAIAEAEALRNQEREVVTKLITKEVIKYVETDNARECGFTDAGVRLHDAAARGSMPEIPDTTSVVDDAAIAATNAEIMLTVTDNYKTCNQTADRLTMLQRWLKGIQNAK
jgi:hypothetical protein